jgi:cyclopropane fatty-acyl-phospholipid synthase-like methyltransferase
MPMETDVSDTPERRWLKAVNEYYDQTNFDYKKVWHSGTSLAYHFGYYADDIHEHQHALTNANQVLAGIARVKSGDRVLDAGCGLGGSSFWLAAHRSAMVVGITPVPGHVTAAKETARHRSLDDRVTFHEADYTDTPFQTASFDVVWALESLCHAVSKAAFYREAARLLRPGGRLVVAEYIRVSRDLGADTESMVREWLDGWSIPDIDTAEEHLAAAAEAGFADARLDDFTGTTHRSLRRLYKLACLARPIDQVLFSLGLRSAAQHGNVVASLRQYQLLQKGAWFYGVLSGTRK